MADVGEELAGTPRRSLRLVRTQRALRIVLGLFWILDAALQFQPFMFTKSFADNFIVANASGQPTVIGWIITNVGHFLTPHIAVWNTFFALIQLAIGVGLLFRTHRRAALAVSFAWALGVWVFGEGLGMILTGSATALTGAPGSVLMYGLIGLMAWPRRDVGGTDEEPATLTGVASSAAGRGIGGAVTPLAVWSGYWVVASILFLLPDNRTRTSITSAIVGMAPGTPGWFAHFLTSFGDFFKSSGAESAWVLAVASLVIGLGPLVVRRIAPFLFVGGLLAALLWITGQGWLGGIFTGTGTDPNTGPLVVLLALAMVPTRLPDPGAWHSRAFRVVPTLEPRPDPERSRRDGLGPLPQCRLPGGGAGVIGHGDERHGRDGGVRRGRVGQHGVVHVRERRVDPVGIGRDQLPLHDHERHARNEHERGRRQRGSRLEHHEGQLALHRASAVAGVGQRAPGRRSQRARSDPHGGERLRQRADVLPADQLHSIRAVDQRGSGPL